ncbi:MAG: lactate utilization protein [Actinobacteria bacterium]|nr:lactate utilization protein [Actinomycetota bacterium]
MKAGFESAAREALGDSQLRRNMARATTTIRARRAAAVAEVEDWEELREAGAAIKAAVMASLPRQLERLERAVEERGGRVHWARDGAEANAIVTDLARAHGAGEVLKVKSITTDEIELNQALAAAGIRAHETDFAELVNQLAGDWSSHILVPAIHRNRSEIRLLFEDTIAAGRRLDEDPVALAAAARGHLRELFLRVPFAVSGANFAVAETGSVAVVESEGNGRMCTTLPEVLVTVMGIEKVLPEWRDLEVFLQLLPRSATGERMNPYTSIWSGVHAGDGPREFHLVLLDNGRTDVLADELGRAALHCIRCSACLNVCPVYSRVGGHAYGSVYPGPIGAVLTPQLRGLPQAPTLPWASSLCGACLEACPVKIDIPTMLVHLRGRVRREVGAPRGERAALAAAFRVLSDRGRYERAQRLRRLGRGALAQLLAAPWSRSRELPEPPPQTFREWWDERG